MWALFRSNPLVLVSAVVGAATPEGQGVSYTYCNLTGA